MGDITSYKLSDIAETDISDIYDYTQVQYGKAQAIQYLTGLDACFNSLVEQPHMGKHRPEIRDGLRSFPYEHHIVFYRLQENFIRIVRVLHESRDVKRFLGDD